MVSQKKKRWRSLPIRSNGREAASKKGENLLILPVNEGRKGGYQTSLDLGPRLSLNFGFLASREVALAKAMCCQVHREGRRA